MTSLSNVLKSSYFSLLPWSKFYLSICFESWNMSNFVCKRPNWKSENQKGNSSSIQRQMWYTGVLMAIQKVEGLHHTRPTPFHHGNNTSSYYSSRFQPLRRLFLIEGAIFFKIGHLWRRLKQLHLEKDPGYNTR